MSVVKGSWLKDGWFRESNPQWPGQAWSLEVDEVLHDEMSDFQHVVVFRNKGPWGNVLLLDGCVQVTDKGEFSYHEMMAHVPLMSHPNPQQVLIIGGGDGGVMREVVKHPSVVECHLVDIDGMVIDVSKKFFPDIACSFAHPKARTTVGDGFAFLEGKENMFDVIVVDSSDPEGPASQLFGKEFYARLWKALKPGGLICTQAECLWLHLPLIQKMLAFVKECGFHAVEYGAMLIPFYPNGTLGCLVARKDNANEKVSAGPVRAVPEDLQSTTKYYTPETHRAIFALPRSVDLALYGKS